MILTVILWILLPVLTGYTMDIVFIQTNGNNLILGETLEVNSFNFKAIIGNFYYIMCGVM